MVWVGRSVMTWVPPSQVTGVTSAGILKQLVRAFRLPCRAQHAGVWDTEKGRRDGLCLFARLRGCGTGNSVCQGEHALAVLGFVRFLRCFARCRCHWFFVGCTL